MDAPIGVGVIGLSATRGWAATAHLPALRAGYEVPSTTGLSPRRPEAVLCEWPLGNGACVLLTAALRPPGGLRPA